MLSPDEVAAKSTLTVLSPVWTTAERAASAWALKKWRRCPTCRRSGGLGLFKGVVGAAVGIYTNCCACGWTPRKYRERCLTLGPIPEASA